MQAFAQKAIGDVGGTLTAIMCSVGDRLGLFKDLATRGPATSVELAARCGLQERYVREWLGQMAVSGYLVYDPGSSRFTLPPEHAAILADEAGPMFLGGLYHILPALVAPLERLIQAFRQGGGVHQRDYDERFWEGLERFTGVGFENFLLQAWIPALPELQRTLERGALVADVGCGAGRALIKLAQAYPKSRYVGYDVYEPAVAKATAKAQASLANGGAGLGTIGLPESRLREFCVEAGFQRVRRIWENPFRVVYEVRP
jgi:hypothetical protein